MFYHGVRVINGISLFSVEDFENFGIEARREAETALLGLPLSVIIPRGHWVQHWDWANGRCGVHLRLSHGELKSWR